MEMRGKRLSKAEGILVVKSTIWKLLKQTFDR